MAGYENQRYEEEQARRLAGSDPMSAPPPGGSQGDGRGEGMQGTQERAQEMGDQARERMSEGMDRAQQGMDQGRERAAEGTERAATQLRERASEQGGTVGKVGERVAGGMESAAGMLREGDTNAMMDEVESYVRQHPMQSVAAAIGAGFLVGRMLR